MLKGVIFLLNLKEHNGTSIRLLQINDLLSSPYYGLINQEHSVNHGN